MADINSMKATLSDLVRVNSGAALPGFDFDTVVNNLVENVPEYKAALDSAEDREAMKKALVDNYKGRGRFAVEQKMNRVNILANNVKKGTQQLTTGVSSSAAALTVPTSLTSPPNPVSIALEAKTKKNTLLNLTDSVTKDMTELLETSIDLYYVLPDSILVLVKVISAIRSSISKIPG